MSHDSHHVPHMAVRCCARSRLGFRPDDVHADLAALPQLFGGHGPHADRHTDLDDGPSVRGKSMGPLGISSNIRRSKMAIGNFPASHGCQRVLFEHNLRPCSTPKLLGYLIFIVSIHRLWLVPKES